MKPEHARLRHSAASQNVKVADALKGSGWRCEAQPVKPSLTTGGPRLKATSGTFPPLKEAGLFSELQPV